MNPTRRRMLLPMVAGACYVASFFLPALYLTGQANTDGRQTHMVGMMAFINGFFALFELQFAWLANALAVLALILILSRVPLVACVVALAAVLVAQHTWAVVGTTIAGDEGGVTKYLVTALGPGFYVWCLSFVIVAAAALLARPQSPPPLPAS